MSDLFRERLTSATPKAAPVKKARFLVEGAYLVSVVEAADAEEAAYSFAIDNGENAQITVTPLVDSVVFNVDLDVKVSRR